MNSKLLCTLNWGTVNLISHRVNAEAPANVEGYNDDPDF